MINIRVVHRPVAEIPSELLVSLIFEESRPPRKSIGEIDWFMNGFISRMISKKSLRLEYGGVNLLATQHRIEAPKLLLLGMGSCKDIEMDLVERCFFNTAHIISDLKINNVAIVSPDLISGEKPSCLDVFEKAIAGIIRGSRDENINDDMCFALVVEEPKKVDVLKNRMVKFLKRYREVNLLPS